MKTKFLFFTMFTLFIGDVYAKSRCYAVDKNGQNTITKVSSELCTRGIKEIGFKAHWADESLFRWNITPKCLVTYSDGVVESLPEDICLNYKVDKSVEGYKKPSSVSLSLNKNICEFRQSFNPNYAIGRSLLYREYLFARLQRENGTVEAKVGETKRILCGHNPHERYNFRWSKGKYFLTRDCLIFAKNGNGKSIGKAPHSFCGGISGFEFRSKK